jgi:DNA-directed RNA polymerase subunit beta'
MKGEKALASYLVDEIQEVYRLQGVKINDKHIEVIVRQMLRWVKIVDVGDTNFLVNEQVERTASRRRTEGHRARWRAVAGRADHARHHQGQSLSTDSLPVGVVLPGDHPVLTEAAIQGKVDHVRGSRRT